MTNNDSNAGDTMSALAVELKKSTGVKMVYTANALCDVVGLLSFTILTMTTLKHKKLHSTCHLLVGFYAASYMCTKMIILPTFFLLINPWLDTFPLLICSFVQLIPLSASYNIFSLMLAIATDRLFSIIFPIWYNMRNDKFYLVAIYSISALYPLFLAFAILHTGFGRPNARSMCTMFEMVGVFNAPVYYLDVAFVLLTVLSYLVILAKVLLCEANNNNGGGLSSRHPVLKSLAIIMTIQIGGWLLGMGAYQAVGLIQGVGITQRYMLIGAANCVVSLASTAEVPSLYFTSSDHRTALTKEFNLLFRLFSKSAGAGNAVSDVAITGVNLRRNTLRNTTTEGGGILQSGTH